jgi:hypothetical protein
MLFGILFAGLVIDNQQPRLSRHQKHIFSTKKKEMKRFGEKKKKETGREKKIKSGRKKQLTFAGLPTFCPMTFHLLCSYSLMAASSAALCEHVLVLHDRTNRYVFSEADEMADLIFRKLGVVHILWIWKKNEYD